MEHQIFWRPPPSRNVLPAPPPLLGQHRQSLDVTARQRTSPAHSGSRSPAIHGQTSDLPISIPSDLGSEKPETEDAVAESVSERPLDTSLFSQSDDTLPPIEEIVASTSGAQHGGIRKDVMHDPRSEDVDGPREAESIHQQPLASYKSGDPGDITVVVPVTSITYEPTDPSASSCTPTRPMPILSSHASPDTVEPAASENDTAFANACAAQPDKPPEQPAFSPARRRSPRISATASKRRRIDENRGGSIVIALPPRSTDSRQAPNNENGELAQTRDTFEDNPNTESRFNYDLSSDSDSFRDWLSHDDDYSPSLADGDDSKQEGYYHKNNTDNDAEESPSKRRRTRQSIPSSRSDRVSSSVPNTLNAKSSLVNRHTSTAVLHSPPRSQASIDGKYDEPDSATFEEWKGKVQLTTINGVTSFEGQFEGELSVNLLQALIQTWSASQKEIRIPACRADGVKRRRMGSRGQFTPEEDDLIIELKTKLNLPWSDTHRRFTVRHAEPPEPTTGYTNEHWL